MKSPAQGRAFRDNVKMWFFLRFFAAQIHNSWCRNEDGTVCSDHYTNHEGKDEPFDVVSSEEEDGQQHDKCAERGIDGPAQSAVQSEVEHLFAVLFASIECKVLSNAVKHHHRVIDGVSNDREDRSNKGLVNFHREGQNPPEDAKERKHNQNVVDHRNQCSQSVLPFAETDEDV